MSLQPQDIPPVPEETRRVAQAAFPRGNVYIRMRDELGAIYDDQLFASLFPACGQPAAPPWRLALTTVMQFAEGLSDRQAADAVRSRIDWKYALSLELTDPGFDHTVLSEFRTRLVAGQAELLLLDTFLAQLRERGLLKGRSRQRTDSTHVLAAIRVLNRLELVGETLRHALNSLAVAAPDWLQTQAPAEWFERYGRRLENYRLPQTAAAREALKVHLTETCEDDQPHLITGVMTTPATTSDCVVGPAIQQDLAQRDLLPGTHLLDGGYVDADLLVTAHTQHQIDVVGPPFGSYSHQRRAGQGYDLSAFVIDWEAQQARCPQGHTSIRWTPGRDVSGDPVVRIRFHAATCRACPVRSACTQAKDAPRQLTVRPQAQHEAIHAARQRQETAEFTAQYARRAGIEGTQSQAIRRCGLRQCRYVGHAKTHLQHVLTATALNLVRVAAWLEDTPRATTRRAAFAALAA
jgi:transposase